MFQLKLAEKPLAHCFGKGAVLWKPAEEVFGLVSLGPSSFLKIVWYQFPRCLL